MKVIGIDTGVSTGVAIWYVAEQKFDLIESMPIHRAMERVLFERPYFVRVEDARLYRHYGKTNPAKIQGAGSVKRDASIWEDFLKDKNIPFEMVSPADNLTKTTADYFRKLTGWTKSTNEHGRDAACLVFKWSLVNNRF
jgi:hypothetical protein